MHDSTYKNKKVNAVIYERLRDLEFTESDFADLALACADQAGMTLRDQKLFEQMLVMALEENKHKRWGTR